MTIIIDLLNVSEDGGGKKKKSKGSAAFATISATHKVPILVSGRHFYYRIATI